MIFPCPRRVLCPPGTGTESDGVNYSSETPEVPIFHGNPFPPTTAYGTYTACRGLCVSNISQADADLCAQRQAKLCSNENPPTGPGGNPKPTYGNTPQICMVQATGRQVFVPAGLFIADSQAEANAQALAYANKLQQDPATPVGPNILQGPGNNPTTIINVIPTPTRQPPHEPPAPPTSQCKPCDDTGAVVNFSVPFDVPDRSGNILQYSPLMKCGIWRFSIETNTPALAGAAATYVTAQLVAGDPDHTFVPSDSLVDCPQMEWQSPCGHGDECTPQDVGEYGIFPGCCDTNFYDCHYVECQTIGGNHYLVKVRIEFVCSFPDFELAHQFTFKGQWLGPIPSP